MRLMSYPLLRDLLLFAAMWRTPHCTGFKCSDLKPSHRSWVKTSDGPPEHYRTGAIVDPSDIREIRKWQSSFWMNATTAPLDIPEVFDARTVWGRCPSISRIGDQGCCSSCWAYAAAGVMTDRHCIHKHEEFDFSVADIIACARRENSTSCQGDNPLSSFRHWIAHGVVSGGGSNTSKGCLPYGSPPLGKDCSKYEVKCDGKCQETFKSTYKDDLRFGEGMIVFKANDTEAIQAEIMLGGPVLATMRAFRDFMCYKQGIYEFVDGSYKSLHAVRLIGWGVENGVPFWIGANSWGTSWGEDGFFRIRRGVDECGIESVAVCAAYPKSDGENGTRKPTQSTLH